MTLVIQFAKSPSIYFKLALELAKSHPSFEERPVGEQSIYKVTLSDSDVELINDLSQIVGGWKSTRITANGRKISHWDISLALFCREHYECTHKRHWCNACPDYKHHIKKIIAAENKDIEPLPNNVIGFPIDLKRLR